MEMSTMTVDSEVMPLVVDPVENDTSENVLGPHDRYNPTIRMYGDEDADDDDAFFDDEEDDVRNDVDFEMTIFVGSFVDGPWIESSRKVNAMLLAHFSQVKLSLKHCDRRVA